MVGAVRSKAFVYTDIRPHVISIKNDGQLDEHGDIGTELRKYGGCDLVCGTVGTVHDNLQALETDPFVDGGLGMGNVPSFGIVYSPGLSQFTAPRSFKRS